MGSVSLFVLRNATLFCGFRPLKLHQMGRHFPCRHEDASADAPEVQQAFERGDFVTKKTASTFNQIPDDQALEHVNKSGKVAGGLVGITRTDSARDCWCLTYNERAKLPEDTKEMFNVLEREFTSAKDLGKARIRQDAEDVAKLEAKFTKYEVFRCTSDLVVVTTEDVASNAIKQDLLGVEEIGEKIIKEFVETRLIKKDIKFHDTLKQQKERQAQGEEEHGN